MRQLEPGELAAYAAVAGLILNLMRSSPRNSLWIPIREINVWKYTRRHFFGLNARGIGVGGAWQALLPCDLRARRETGGAAGLAAFRAQGQARNLSVPVRRAVADGTVRLQAAASTKLRARNCPTRSATGSGSRDDRRRNRAFPSCRPIFKFAQHGRSGAWISELLPHTAKIADDLRSSSRCTPRRSTTIPAVTFLQTGSQLAGRPEHRRRGFLRPGQREQDLPAFVVMTRRVAAAATSRSTTGCGAAVFCRRRYQGVKFRSGGDPVLYLSEPAGISTRDAGAYLWTR